MTKHLHSERNTFKNTNINQAQDMAREGVAKPRPDKRNINATALHRQRKPQIDDTAKEKVRNGRSPTEIEHITGAEEGRGVRGGKGQSQSRANAKKTQRGQQSMSTAKTLSKDSVANGFRGERRRRGQSKCKTNAKDKKG